MGSPQQPFYSGLRGHPQAFGSGKHRRVQSSHEGPPGAGPQDQPLVEAANIPRNWKRRSQSHGQPLSGDGVGFMKPERPQYEAKRATTNELMERLANLESMTRELAGQLDLERASKRSLGTNGRRGSDTTSSSFSTVLSSRSGKMGTPPDVYAPLPGILNEDQIRAKAPMLLAEKLQNKSITARPSSRLLIHSTENLGGKLLEIQQYLINSCIGYHNWSSELAHFFAPPVHFFKSWIDPATPWPETCHTLLLCGSVNKNDLHALRFLRLANTHPREGESLSHFLQRYQRAANDLDGLCSDYNIQILLNYILGRYPELNDTVKSVCCKSRSMDEFFRAYEYLSPIGFYFPKAQPLSKLEAGLLSN
jgi:hypothetical protein